MEKRHGSPVWAPSLEQQMQLERRVSRERAKAAQAIGKAIVKAIGSFFSRPSRPVVTPIAPKIRTPYYF